MNNSSEQNKNDKDVSNKDDSFSGFRGVIEALKDVLNPDEIKVLEAFANENYENIFKDPHVKFYL